MIDVDQSHGSNNYFINCQVNLSILLCEIVNIFDRVLDVGHITHISARINLLFVGIVYRAIRSFLM